MGLVNETALLPAFLDGKPKLLLIDGKLVPALSGRTFETINPSTGKVLAQVAEAGEADIDLAVAAARRAFDEGPWRKFKPFDRQAVLLKLADLVDEHFDELAMLDTLDMGGPVASTAGKRRRAVALLRYYAGLATATHGQTIENSQPGEIFSYTLKEPVGVVNVVAGFGAAGAALAAHPGVDKVAFTGSTEVGQAIIRASAGNVKRVSLELGGKSPNIVFADADLDAAVPGAAMAVFANSGQICSAGTRLFVEEAVYDEFVERVSKFARGLRVGDPLDPQTQLGPLVSQAQLERVTGYLEKGRAQGARAAAGGTRLSEGALAEGYFVAPTVFADVKDEMAIAREEIFGPVISALPFKQIDEVLRRANATEYGLGSGVWTRNVDNVQRISRGLRAGSVWVNCYQAMDPAVPFGGYKQRG